MPAKNQRAYAHRSCAMSKIAHSFLHDLYNSPLAVTARRNCYRPQRNCDVSRPDWKYYRINSASERNRSPKSACAARCHLFHLRVPTKRNSRCGGNLHQKRQCPGLPTSNLQHLSKILHLQNDKSYGEDKHVLGRGSGRWKKYESDVPPIRPMPRGYSDLPKILLADWIPRRPLPVVNRQRIGYILRDKSRYRVLAVCMERNMGDRKSVEMSVFLAYCQSHKGTQRTKMGKFWQHTFLSDVQFFCNLSQKFP